MSNEEQLELNFTSHVGEGVTTSGSILRREIQEMQKQVHGLQMRVKELAEENYGLRKRIDGLSK